MTIHEFTKAQGITATVKRIAQNPNMEPAMPNGSSHWMVTLKIGELGRNYREMAVPFSQGPAIKEDPTAEDVLDCLASDASGIQNARGFEDWCAEYGLDSDSRRAEKIYQVARKHTLWLKEHFLFPAQFETLLWHVERL